MVAAPFDEAIRAGFEAGALGGRARCAAPAAEKLPQRSA
jgi:hypothetical protein